MLAIEFFRRFLLHHSGPASGDEQFDKRARLIAGCFDESSLGQDLGLIQGKACRKGKYFLLSSREIRDLRPPSTFALSQVVASACNEGVG